MDALDDYLTKELERVGLVDLEPRELKPTWVSNKGDYATIAKCLYHLLVHSQVLVLGRKIRSWIHKSRISHHFPIFIEFLGNNDKRGNPFKFNPMWVLEKYFKFLIYTH